MVVLKEVRNVKYADFVQPGQTLTITAEILKQDDRETQLKAQGTVAGKPAVSGRVVLERYNLAEQRPDLAVTDALVSRQMRELLANLWNPALDLAGDEFGASGPDRGETNGAGHAVTAGYRAG
jgi:3-hydroxyacyl-[acyl-carrier-protein] dehydratase